MTALDITLHTAGLKLLGRRTAIGLGLSGAELTSWPSA